MVSNIKAFIAPHLEEKYALCQDRFHIDTEKLFFAVSDGVSSSVSPTYYAKTISSYYENKQVSLSKTDAERIFNIWKQYMEDLLSKGKLGRGTTQRYKRGETPSATYSRFDIKKNTQSGEWQWNAAVLGDCSVLHLNPKEQGYKPIHVILSGTKFHDDEYKYNSDFSYYKFGKLPDQLTSTGNFLGSEAVFKNTLKKGDIFLLMTDGISDWILGSQHEIESRIEKLLSLENQLDFIQLVEEKRANKTEGREMENDDITLVILKFDDIDSNTNLVDKRSYVTDIDQQIRFEKEFKYRKIGFIREFEEKIIELEKECCVQNNKYRVLVNTLSQEKKASEVLRNKNENLQKRIEELEGNNKELEKEHGEQGSKYKMLENTLSQEKKTSEALGKENKNLQKRIKELEGDNKDSEKLNSSVNITSPSSPKDNLENIDNENTTEKKKTIFSYIKQSIILLILIVILILQLFTMCRTYSIENAIKFENKSINDNPNLRK